MITVEGIEANFKKTLDEVLISDDPGKVLLEALKKNNLLIAELLIEMPDNQ